MPEDYTQDVLREELKDIGFSGLYDFLFLPVGPDGVSSHGCAFINFLEDRLAYKFKWMYLNTWKRLSWDRRRIKISPLTKQAFLEKYSAWMRTNMNSKPAPKTSTRSAPVVRYCFQCGGPVSTKFRFCTKCGVNLMVSF
jgi:hypothetical protein